MICQKFKVSVTKAHLTDGLKLIMSLFSIFSPLPRFSREPHPFIEENTSRRTSIGSSWGAVSQCGPPETTSIQLRLLFISNMFYREILGTKDPRGAAAHQFDGSISPCNCTTAAHFVQQPRVYDNCLLPRRFVLSSHAPRVEKLLHSDLFLGQSSASSNSR